MRSNKLYTALYALLLFLLSAPPSLSFLDQDYDSALRMSALFVSYLRGNFFSLNELQFDVRAAINLAVVTGDLTDLNLFFNGEYIFKLSYNRIRYGRMLGKCIYLFILI